MRDPSTCCTVRGVRNLGVVSQSGQGGSYMLDVRLTDIFPDPTLAFVSLRKTNYALFPLIKPLISADGFRNMKQNSE